MTREPILDPAALQRLRDWGGASLPRKLIEIFLTQSSERLELIRAGVSSSTARTAEAGAHSLKSSAGNVGAVQVQRLAEEVETLARDGEMERLANLLPRLEDAYQSACGELRILMEGMEE